MGRGDHPGEGADADPYKLVTITSGFAGYNIWLFILCSIVARGGRFFVLAVLLNRYGDQIRSELEKRLGTVGRHRGRRSGARLRTSRLSSSSPALCRVSASGYACNTLDRTALFSARTQLAHRPALSMLAMRRRLAAGAPQPSLGLQSPAQQSVPAQPPPQAERAAAPPREENPGLINDIGKLWDKSISLLPTLKSPWETFDDINARAKGRRREPVEHGKTLDHGERAGRLRGCRQRCAGLQGRRRPAVPEQGLQGRQEPRHGRGRKMPPKVYLPGRNASRATARQKIT